MTSKSTEPPSRDFILSSVQNITGWNYEDSISHLNRYNWQLKDLINDFFKRPENFKAISVQTKPKSLYPDLNNPTNNSDPKKITESRPTTVDRDRELAELLHVYGDNDEYARQYRPKEQRMVSQVKEKEENTRIYHERQKYLRCGLHSLNNLFQIPDLFTTEHLDGIVRRFDQRHVFNDYGQFHIGDYDLRVLIEAIRHYGFHVEQINFFRGPTLQQRPWDSYFGLLVNLNGSHWLTIKNVNGSYHNLDSTLKKPKNIGQKDDLVRYLIDLIQRSSNVYLFVVIGGSK